MSAITGEARFAHNMPDTEWLPEIAANGWLLITKDLAIRKNLAEIDAIMTNRIGCFLLPRSLNGPQTIALVLQVRRRLENIPRGRTKPFIYAFQPSGRDERRDTAQWLEAWRTQRAIENYPPLLRDR